MGKIWRDSEGRVRAEERELLGACLDFVNLAPPHSLLCHGHCRRISLLDSSSGFVSTLHPPLTLPVCD